MNGVSVGPPRRQHSGSAVLTGGRKFIGLFIKVPVHHHAVGRVMAILPGVVIQDTTKLPNERYIVTIRNLEY